MLTLDLRHATDGTTVITAAGDLDATTAARLSTAVHHELDNRPAALVLDLTEVSSIDVAGFQVLHCAADRSAALAIPVRLLGLNAAGLESVRGVWPERTAR